VTNPPTPTAVARKVSPLAVPFLGFFGAVQGSGPNIASTALVGASRSLDLTGSTQALAASMQTLAVAATVITTGMLADRLGRRRVLMVALVAGAVGNLVVMASPNAAVYMAGMVVTGAGLGAVYGAAFGFIKSVVKPGRLAGAMGLFTASVMFFTLLLTFAGGTLATANWRTAFLLLPAMCIVGLVLTPVLLPKLPAVAGGALDVVGQLLLAAGVVGLLFGMSGLASSLTSPATLVPIVAGTALLVGFVLWERRTPTRFFPIQLLGSPVFLAALCFGFIYNFGNSVSFLQLTNLWQYVNGLTTSRVAVWQLPLLIAGIAAGLITGRLMGRGLSNRAAGVGGGVLTTVGFIVLALSHTSSTVAGFVPGSMLVGAGVVVAAVPFGNLVLREAPPEYLGPVSSSRTTFGQFFYTLGFSLSTVTIDRLTSGGTTARLEAAGVPANQLSTGLDAVNVYASSGTRPDTALGQQALSDATASYGTAFMTTFLVVAGVVGVVTALGWWLLRHGEGEAKPAHVEGAALEHEPA
jgi:MFS family permease